MTQAHTGLREGLVRVKPLPWEDRGETVTDQFRSDTVVGVYYIGRSRSGLWEWRSSATRGKYEVRSLEQARTEAQADYERRILSCLLPDPALEKAREAAWRTMDSAPKDGTLILAVCWFAMEFDATDMSPEYHVVQWDELEGSGWLDQGGLEEAEASFTHWMPLPAPPVLSSLPEKEGERG